jgi:hypothetical protein
MMMLLLTCSWERLETQTAIVLKQVQPAATTLCVVSSTPRRASFDPRTSISEAAVRIVLPILLAAPVGARYCL